VSNYPEHMVAPMRDELVQVGFEQLLTPAHVDAALQRPGTTLLLGRAALAWREGRSDRSFIPRLHRAAGALTLALTACTLVVWFLRHRG